MDNATSRKEVVIAVENVFNVIKHYSYTLENDIEAREKAQRKGELPKTAETPDQANTQLGNNREQREPIHQLLAQAEKLKNLLENGEITYRDIPPFS